MKILHIGKYYPPYFGGIEKVNYDLVESLNEDGFSTDVLCFNNQNKTQVENKGYNIYRTATINAAYSSPLSFSIFKHLRKIHSNYDIIHLHVPNPMGAVALQSVSFKGKIIVHWHSDIIKQKKLKKIYRPFQEKLLQRADKIIVTTPNYLEGSDDLKPYRNKCKVIPIGISKSDFKSNELFREQLKQQYKNKKVVFSIGRLIYYKGFEHLIDSIKKLPDNIVVLIGGTGILKENLQKQIKQNRVEDKVTLLGNVPFEKLGEYYNRADIYCLPSTERSEAFGVVLIEAMSFGCPIVSTNIKGSGVAWVNRNNETGIVVEPKNSDLLAEAITRIATSSELATKFSANSLKRYNAEFTKEKMTERTIELYKTLLH
jgi:rhamnosyl/mannosyltransferase